MKLHKFNSEELVCYYNSTKPVSLPNYEYKEDYVRGVWVSNVVNIDTPKMKDIESYKEYLVKMVENIASYNINLMIFQVRPASDAYYESKLNPWSRFITGVEGQNPGFDVLKFVIEEAKKYNYRNEKCHIGRLYIPIKDTNNEYFSSVIFVYFENSDKYCEPLLYIMVLL